MISLLLNIDVPDLEAGIAFYTGGLGFALKGLLFDSTVAELECGGLSVFLIQQKTGSLAVPDPEIHRDYARHWTPVHFDVVVAEIGSAMGRAIAAGATRESQVRNYSFGKLARMRDPFGHGFCLIEFAGDGYAAASSA